MSNLALSYRDMGNDAQALAIQTEALALRKETFGRARGNASGHE